MPVLCRSRGVMPRIPIRVAPDGAGVAAVIAGGGASIQIALSMNPLPWAVRCRRRQLAHQIAIRVVFSFAGQWFSLSALIGPSAGVGIGAVLDL